MGSGVVQSATPPGPGQAESAARLRGVGGRPAEGWGPRLAPPAGGAAPRRLLPRARRPPGISRRARFRRWQRWPSPERPAMAGAPGPLRLALLLLGAVGRAGPRPQVRLGAREGWGRAGGRRRVPAGAAGLERNSATAPEGPVPGGAGTAELAPWAGWTRRRGGGDPPSPARRPLPGRRGPSTGAPAAPRPPALTSEPRLPRHFPNSFSSDTGPAALPSPASPPPTAPDPCPAVPAPPARPACPLPGRDPEPPWERERARVWTPSPSTPSPAPSTAFDS